MNIISLFSGAGGLDLGFTNAGFNTIWANDFNNKVESTYNANHMTPLTVGDITKIDPTTVPEAHGIIGGPPCQSWSVAGSGRGIEDDRGQLFDDYIRFIGEKNPLFFVAENVKGILSKKHNSAKEAIIQEMENAGQGYTVTMGLLNAKDYRVPQLRERVFFIGFRNDLNITFNFDRFKEMTHENLVQEFGENYLLTLQDTIIQYQESAVPATENNSTVNALNNNEYGVGSFSTQFMSRNRVKTWEEQSFTIQAGLRHIPIHPQAPVMEKIATDICRFIPGHEHQYRRFSVREAAAIQTFPENFNFIYQKLADAYQMIGNAVPVKLAEYVARHIKFLLEEHGYWE